MKKGEILKGTNRNRKAAYHPIVYLGGNINGPFTAVVLTHSKKQDNVPMKREHFIEIADGTKHKFTFDSTWVVGKCFFKPREWGPYKKNGELSAEGIKFVECVTSNQPPILWDEYVKSQRKARSKGALDKS